jgi:uncharacterized protein (TIGR02284 family)
MATTTHEPLQSSPKGSADREEQHIHTVDTARHVGLPMAGAVSGAALGAFVGAIAGPPGVVTGAVFGGIAGAAAGRALDVDESRVSKHDGELDDEAVRSENMRAAPLPAQAQAPRTAAAGAQWAPDSWPPENGSSNGGRLMQTTETVSSNPHRVQVVRVLNGLIEASVDGEKRFGEAAADARAPVHKATLHRYGEQRAEFTTALQDAVARMGASSLNEGSTLGALSRGLESMKLALLAHDDALVLRDCADGDALAARTYDIAHNALLRADAPAGILALIDGQRAEIALASAHLARLGAFASS